ncbi:MAG TPA: RIP metalloprotease RseP [Clostridiales bacterium]|nr:RIP metalloprotease RseP [Clostridiales bacterium]
MVYISVALLIIIGILLFELIIFLHEFGHFITAKLFGVQVNEFALGMGPRIFKFTKGETTYSLRAFPIGGFCDLEGENGGTDNPRAFSNKAVWKRMIIIVAGAVMNIILGLLMMLVLVAQQPTFASTTIGSFPDNSTSQTNGLEVGDKFVSIDGYAIMNARDITFSLATMKTTSPHIVVDRNGERTDLGAVQFSTTKATDGETDIISLDFYVLPIEKNVFTVIGQTCEQTISVVRLIWSSLIGMLTGQYSLNDMAGPIGAASAISNAASVGLQSSFLDAFNNILFMMMVITVNLGIFNMLPVPALDGGRFFFLLIELIRRKPIPEKYESVVHGVGFALLMAFMVVVAFNDIWRIVTGSGFGG